MTTLRVFDMAMNVTCVPNIRTPTLSFHRPRSPHRTLPIHRTRAVHRATIHVSVGIAVRMSIRGMPVRRCNVSPRAIPASRTLVYLTLEDRPVLWSIPAARPLIHLALEMRAIVRSVATSGPLIHLPLEPRPLIVMAVPAAGPVVHLPLKRTAVHGALTQRRARPATITASRPVIAVSLEHGAVQRAWAVVTSVAAAWALVMSPLEYRTVHLPAHLPVRRIWRWRVTRRAMMW